MGDDTLTAQEKRAQRALGRSRRGRLTPEQRRSASEEICRSIARLEAFQRARRVFSYAAHGAEADLAPLRALSPEKLWYYPLCQAHGGMEALRPLDPSAWQKGAFGIREPLPERSERCAPEELDLVLVPLTAFDAQCRRVGMGGGYYDRFLPRCTAALWVGAAFACQRVERAATERWDRSLDLVVTEEGCYAPPERREQQPPVSVTGGPQRSGPGEQDKKSIKIPDNPPKTGNNNL